MAMRAPVVRHQTLTLKLSSGMPSSGPSKHTQARQRSNPHRETWIDAPSQHKRLIDRHCDETQIKTREHSSRDSEHTHARVRLSELVLKTCILRMYMLSKGLVFVANKFAHRQPEHRQNTICLSFHEQASTRNACIEEHVSPYYSAQATPGCDRQHSSKISMAHVLESVQWVDATTLNRPSVAMLHHQTW